MNLMINGAEAIGEKATGKVTITDFGSGVNAREAAESFQGESPPGRGPMCNWR